MRLASVAVVRPRLVMPSLFPSQRSVGLFSSAFVITVALLLVNVVDPYSGAVASPYYIPATSTISRDGQEVTVAGTYTTAAGRDAVTVTGRSAAKASATAPAAGTPDPDTAQALGLAAVKARGWGMEQYDCLVALWNRESHWNVYAHNTGSGAYGIPQALPGEKMATVADDWQTNPATQIEWGLRYIEGRYGSPCGAWAHSEAVHWY
ncbi:MAG: hypothetical protein KGM14_00975 [Actinomycetales bacterium]|nr:hypothetical protein [Actinomycetales bacterium]